MIEKISNMPIDNHNSIRAKINELIDYINETCEALSDMHDFNEHKHKPFNAEKAERCPPHTYIKDYDGHEFCVYCHKLKPSASRVSESDHVILVNTRSILKTVLEIVTEIKSSLTQ